MNLASTAAGTPAQPYSVILGTYAVQYTCFELNARNILFVTTICLVDWILFLFVIISFRYNVVITMSNNENEIT